jgi:hypothetical protein
MNDPISRNRGKPSLAGTPILSLVVGLALLSPASAQPMPKIGACPSGYHHSGGYCAPSSTAGPAIAKTGQCPTGYHASGDYCLGQKGGRHAVHRVGACPINYGVSGAYCLSNR